ncbi:MAG: hypothetical protein ACQEP4_03550 [Bacillota bacterium]
MKKTVFLIMIFALLANLVFPGLSLIEGDVISENAFLSVAYGTEGETQEDPEIDIDVDISDGTGEDSEGRGLMFYLIAGAIIVVVLVAIVSMTNSKK